MSATTSNPTSAKSIILASLSALTAAALVLFGAVLPAEYGYDPIGTGKMLGLTALSKSEAETLYTTNMPLQQDAIVFELEPFEAVEYKYRLADEHVLLFSWESDGELLFDLHAEPDGAKVGYAETFEKSRGTRRAGQYTAAFDGIHGWYWQNRTEDTVVLTLQSSGFFTTSHEMQNGQTFTYDIKNNERSRARENTNTE